MNMYCLKCKKISKNKKPYVIGNCMICKKSKSKFVSKKEITGNSLLSNIFRNIPVLNKIF